MAGEEEPWDNGWEDEFDTSSISHAGFYSRYLAFRIDGLVCALFISAPIIIITIAFLRGIFVLLGILMVFIVPELFYFSVLEANWNTVGKNIAGIKVVDRQKNPISFKQALVRNSERLIWIIPLLGQLFLYLSVSGIKEYDVRFGDDWAGTYVIEDSSDFSSKYRTSPRKADSSDMFGRY